MQQGEDLVNTLKTNKMDLKNSKFGKILTRNNKQIRDDRAIAIIEDVELEYKREIENMDRDLKRLRRERDAALDLSPGNTYSLTVEKFDAALFVKKDLEKGVEIRNLEIKLEIAQKKYDDLFSPEEAAEVIAP